MDPLFIVFFFFNDTATTEIYTLSLHDALPIYWAAVVWNALWVTIQTVVRVNLLNWLVTGRGAGQLPDSPGEDRKSTRLNSSHANISYAVFCLKKKKKLQLSSYLL